MNKYPNPVCRSFRAGRRWICPLLALAVLPGVVSSHSTPNAPVRPVFGVRALRDEAGLPLLIPHPKKVSGLSGAPFTLNAHTRILVPDGATEEQKRGPVLLQQEIAARFGVRLPILSASQAGKAGTSIENVIVFDIAGVAKPNPLAMRMQKSGQTPPTPAKPEGYAVSVSPRAVLVCGRDARGALWGAQTVIQLLDGTPGSAQILAASVADWPSLPLRGVHLFHGQNALPFHQKLIDRVLSRYKMNALFLEVERTRWDADPQIAPEWAGNKAQLKQEIAFARARGMTPYPLFQSFGHMEWMLDRGDRAKYAEDAQTPYALNMTDPKAVAYMDKLVGETDALFNAPGFHVGLDEVALRGRFPYRSKSTNLTYSSLYLKGAKHWRDYFKARNKNVFVWADTMLCASEVAPSFGTAPNVSEAAKVRAGMPKDVTLVDWQYGEHDRFPSLAQLKAAGFKDLIAATWYRTRNIQNFTRAATQVGARGAIQTTWAGYESKEDVLNTWDSRRQFTAMILAAEYFWNGGTGPAPNKLPYDPVVVFTKQWDAR